MKKLFHNSFHLDRIIVSTGYLKVEGVIVAVPTIRKKIAMSLEQALTEILPNTRLVCI